MPIILYLGLTLHLCTKGLGFLHFIANLLTTVTLLFIFVCVMKMSYKAYKKGASPLIFAYGTYGVYPLVYGVGSIIQCVPSWLWVWYFMNHVELGTGFTMFQFDSIAYTLALSAYCWFFYKKLAKAFDKDEAFAKKLFFAYPLALKELAFGDSEYVLKCRCEPTPKYIPKDERVNTTVNEDVDED